MARTGLLGFGGATAFLRSAPALWRSGLTPAAGFVIGAARYPHRPALVDETGSWTFSETADRVERLAGSLVSRGISRSDRVAIMCRNHRGFVEALAAVSRIGADAVLLGTSLAPPQIRSVVERERVAFFILDEEFLGLAEGLAVRSAVTDPDRWEGAGAVPVPRTPFRGTRYVLLTSGTTREPRSAGRPTPLTLDPLLAFTDRVPLRVGDVTFIASPLYHALGLGQLGLALALSSTVVLQRVFDAESVLRAVEQNQVRVLVAVPAMLAQMADLAPAIRRRYDTSSLRVVVSSGSALGGDLAARFMDIYGEVIYNLYGSTEAAFATVATPADLRAAPGTVGRPLRGVVVQAVDESGNETPVGVTGRVIVGGSLSLGDGPSQIPGHRLATTGDLGHFDRLGRLYVDGREDDMIVSGGENIYPQPIEDVLMTHPDVAEAAVIGRPDSRFGQRVVAFVVARPGHAVDPEALRRHVREKLPRYMAPREVIPVEGLPHNGMGKTLHRPLRQGVMKT
ncbi:MAG TPA: AMP-binding protein [Acidimicrobiales bacterium]|nr:AMP-binding protein [Acidimicrobiales bacterium]